MLSAFLCGKNMNLYHAHIDLNILCLYAFICHDVLRPCMRWHNKPSEANDIGRRDLRWRQGRNRQSTLMWLVARMAARVTPLLWLIVAHVKQQQQARQLQQTESVSGMKRAWVNTSLFLGSRILSTVATNLHSV